MYMYKKFSHHVNKGFTLYLFVDSSSKNKEDKDGRYSRDSLNVKTLKRDYDNADNIFFVNCLSVAQQ